MWRWALALVVGVAGCRPGPPPARLPTLQEAGAESVLANYAPAKLRVFPDRDSAGGPRYLVLASGHPTLPEAWRPLAVVDGPVPADFLPRPGDLAWAGDHVIAGAVEGGAAKLRVYDRDGKVVALRPVPLPGPCHAESPPLLQMSASGLRGLVRCPAEDRAYLFHGDASGAVSGAVPVSGMGAAEVWLPSPADAADYVLAGRRLVRVPASGAGLIIGTVPPPGGGAETREMVRAGPSLLVLSGAVGQVIRMDPATLRWQAEERFPVGLHVDRLRAVPAGDHLIVVVSERVQGGTALYGVSVPILGRAAPIRLILDSGSGFSPSDHELVPAKTAPGALLVRTHRGATGPVVALTRLRY